MARYPYISELPEPRNARQYADKWLQLSQETIDRIDESDKSTIHDRVCECAETRAAEDLISKMQREAARHYAPSTRWLIRGVVVLMGALTFGQGFFLLTSAILPQEPLSNFVPVATFLGGLTASAYVDTLATQALTNKEKSRVLHKHRQQFKVNQRQAQVTGTELTENFHRSQVNLVESVEQIHGVWQLPLSAISACVLSLIEFGVTLYVVDNALAPDGVFASLQLLTEDTRLEITVAIAALPVVITWAASRLQSLYFERPDYLRDLITQYERHVTPDVELSDEAFRDWAYQRLYEDGRIHAGVLHVLGHNASHLKNVTMARGAHGMGYREQRMRQLQQSYKQDTHALYTRYQDDLLALPAQAVLPPLIETGRSDLEIAEQEERRQYLCRLWVEQEEPRLLKRLQIDLALLKADYTEEIKREAEKWKAAEAEYNEGDRQWQKLNQYKHDSFDNDAA